MKDVKDTLGIKYDKYATIYSMDNEQLGLLIKYLMWEHGKDVILQDLPKISQDRIRRYSEKIKPQIDKLMDEDFYFEQIFIQMTQQVKKSHRCWQVLKDNLENAKNKKQGTDTTEEKEEKEKQTETEIKTEIKTHSPDECWINDKGDIEIDYESLQNAVKNSIYDEKAIKQYIVKNKKDLFLPTGLCTFSIEQITNYMIEDGVKQSESFEDLLPINVGDC